MYVYVYDIILCIRSTAVMIRDGDALSLEGCAKVTDIAHKSVQVKITNRPTGGTLPDRNPGASPDELRHRYGDFYRQMWYTPSTACSARNCGCAAAAQNNALLVSLLQPYHPLLLPRLRFSFRNTRYQLCFFL